MDIKLTKQEQQKLFKEVQGLLEEPKVTGTKKMLIEIFRATDLAASRYQFPGKTSQEVQNIRKSKEFKRIYYDRKRQLLALKKQKLVEIEEKAGKLEVVLTELGSIEVLKQLIRGQQKLPNKLKVFVIFDFPEHVKETRRWFRYLLKSSGFKLEQRSVWTTDKDVVKVLRAYLQRAEIAGGWVQVVLGRNVLEIK